jgi:hypothetical protein
MSSGVRRSRRVKSAIAAAAKVSPRGAALVDWTMADKHSAWGGPMNGQIARQRLVRDLVCVTRPQAVVETGTHRGTTTQFLAYVTGGPVFTVESDERFYHFAERRLRALPNCHLSFGDSRTFLKQLALTDACPKERVLFYLDAHWQEDLPLPQELEVITEHWADPLILIDDFQVPHDSGYGFDDYGPGKRLTADDVPPLPGMRLLSPTIPSGEETGGRRGCCLIVSDARAATLSDLPLA